jgi:hypothetical protein
MMILGLSNNIFTAEIAERAEKTIIPAGFRLRSSSYAPTSRQIKLKLKKISLFCAAADITSAVFACSAVRIFLNAVDRQ